MSSSTHTVMPGTFSFESTLPPKVDVNVGAKSHIFQPPTDASSSLHFSRASLSGQDDRSHTKRKRSQHDSRTSGRVTTTPTTMDAWSSMAFDSPSACGMPDAESPAPFVSDKYRLAGGLDTPTAQMASTVDHDYFESTDRQPRGGRSIRPQDVPGRDGYFPHDHVVSALARERNGQPRISNSPALQDGLGRAVYTVAGKVWEFCRTTAFRGFFAGGGQGFEMRGATRSGDGEQSMWHDVEEKDLVFWHDEGACTPVPGRFPEEDFIPDYMSQDHTSPPRGAKRVQREQGSGEISSSWTMVGKYETLSRETSPRRISTRKIPPSTASPGRRTVPKLGRRPILPASRPSLTSFAGSPSLRADRTASYASPRLPGVNTSPKHESSPVNEEVQKHAARMRKRELEEDASIKKFNQQLKAMIKEGKEALGTKFEVEEDIGWELGRGW